MVTCGDELAGPDERPLSASVRLLHDAQTFITPVTLTVPMSETTPPDGAEVVVAPTAVAPDSPEAYIRGAHRLPVEIPGGFPPHQ